MVRNMLFAKLKNPNSFSSPCLIGNVSVDRALCDLGSSVIVMPYSIFKKLILGALQPIPISLQLVDSPVKC